MNMYKDLSSNPQSPLEKWGWAHVPVPLVLWEGWKQEDCWGPLCAWLAPGSVRDPISREQSRAWQSQTLYTVLCLHMHKHKVTYHTYIHTQLHITHTSTQVHITYTHTYRDTYDSYISHIYTQLHKTHTVTYNTDLNITYTYTYRTTYHTHEHRLAYHSCRNTVAYHT